jgi:hypothetical protein
MESPSKVKPKGLWEQEPWLVVKGLAKTKHIKKKPKDGQHVKSTWWRGRAWKEWAEWAKCEGVGQSGQSVEGRAKCESVEGVDGVKVGKWVLERKEKGNMWLSRVFRGDVELACSSKGGE